jgi:hypothetical protein
LANELLQRGAALEQNLADFARKSAAIFEPCRYVGRASVQATIQSAAMKKTAFHIRNEAASFNMRLDLPNQLRPTKFIPFELRSRWPIRLPHCYPIFTEWSGPRPAFSFGGKKFLNYRGTPVFAEIYVLRLLQEQGWDGVWISSLSRKLLRDMPTDTNLSNGVTLPCERHAMLNKVAWSSGGCFDVFAWRGDDVLFCECKHHKTDVLRDAQLRWIDVALDGGLGANNLLVAEWDVRSSVVEGCEFHLVAC